MIHTTNNYIDDDEFQSCSSSDGCDDSFHSTSLPLSSSLNSYFSDSVKNFNTIHINAQSIPAHYPDMLASFDCEHLHAILVSETWFKPSLPSTSYSLPGFCLIRNDRIGRTGGGVAIYLRSQIPYKVISMSTQPPPADAAEHILIEITLSNLKLLLGVFYSPSLQINYFTSFENILDTYTPSYNHTIIMGDFNTCLLKNDNRSRQLLSTVNACNMQILPLNATHNFPNCAPSLLDLILVSCPDYVYKHGQCASDAFSYHDLVYLSYKIRPPKAKSRILLQRNFSGMNIENLLHDASKIDWSPITDAPTIDEKVQMFNYFITALFDVHAPIRPVRIKNLPAPWLTEEIKLLQAKRNKAKVKLKAQYTEENLKKYKLCRNHCNKVCRDAQRRHIHESIENEDSSKVWKFLKSLGVGKTRSEALSNNFNINLLNQYFSTTSSMDARKKDHTLTNLSTIPTPDYPPFIFNQFAVCDVEKSVKSIASNAVGSDCISRNMIIPILSIIAPIITHILNSSILSGKFPDLWKQAKIIPLPKKPNPVSFSDYRPISILPFLSKVLERLVHQQLSNFLLRNGLLNPFQSGFRPGHSTTTALTKIIDDISFGMDRTELTVLSLLDFSNAFNNVDFDILLSRLRSINVSPAAIEWFQSYLCDRQQRIQVEDSVSSWCNIHAGVPQGGVLSPLLFAIFINPITELISASYHLYADDLQIYVQASLQDLNKAIESMNIELTHIIQWSKFHGLTINSAKTQAIIIGSPKLISKIDFANLLPVQLDSIIIPYSETVKNLGIILDRACTWAPHLQELSRKLYATVSSLRRLRNFLPIPTKIALAQSLLHPILDYADASYFLTEDQLNKLERLQNLCIRFIFGLRKYDRVSYFRQELKWPPIRIRRNIHVLTLLYSILFNPSAPSYLKHHFQFMGSSNPNLRPSTHHFLKTPAHNTNFYNKSFTVQAIKLWNSLPLAIKTAQSQNIFKKLIKTHFSDPR